MRWFKASDEFYQHLDPDEVFLALASCPGLESVNFPPLKQEQIQILAKIGATTEPSLSSLTIALGERCIAPLASKFGYVEYLRLKLLDSSSSALRLCCAFQNLSAIYLDFSESEGVESSIYGDDFIAIAKKCCVLVELRISDFRSDSPPTAIAVTDETIETFVQLQPHLMSFFLFLEDTPLTEDSVIALALHCSELCICELSADVAFSELVLRLPEAALSELQSLVVYSDIDSEIEGDSKELATDLVKIAPMMGEFLYMGSREFTANVRELLKDNDKFQLFDWDENAR